MSTFDKGNLCYIVLRKINQKLVDVCDDVDRAEWLQVNEYVIYIKSHNHYSARGFVLTKFGVRHIHKQYLKKEI